MDRRSWSRTSEDRATLAIYECQYGRPPVDTADGAWMYGEARDRAQAALNAATSKLLGMHRLVPLRRVMDIVGDYDAERGNDRSAYDYVLRELEKE